MSRQTDNLAPLGVPSTKTAAPLEATALRGAERSLGDQLRSGQLLVAVTGGPDTAAPVAVAHALEQRYATTVSAIQVIDISAAPLPTPLPSAFALARKLIGDGPYEADARALREQFAELLGVPNAWPVNIALGTPVTEILRHAEAHGAALIVMGLRHHGTVDRLFRDETTLAVARHAHAPVLAVVPAMRGLPRRAVVGVDFGPASIRAARAALDVLARPVNRGSALLRLVYVDRGAGDAAREESGERVIVRLGVKAAFEQLIRELDVPAEIHVDSTTLYGEPSVELMAFATESEADLIAVGSQRHDRVERWILGSVTAEIVRDGRCSVLVIPPPRDR